MNFGEAISSGFNRYVDFEGRSSRAEYWWWTLFAILVNIAATVIDLAIFATDFGAASAIAALGLILPGTAVAVRRLHDLGKRGWWLLLIFVPVIGAVVLLVWYCMKGTMGDNRFGSDPLQAAPE